MLQRSSKRDINYRPFAPALHPKQGFRSPTYNSSYRLYYATLSFQLSAPPTPATVATPTALERVAADMQVVDGVIRQQLASDVPLVAQVAEYLIGAGGKRVRPALLLLMCQALGCTDARRHSLAAVVEFIHTATLLHDDVVDESALRRGRDTAN